MYSSTPNQENVWQYEKLEEKIPKESSNFCGFGVVCVACAD